MWCTLLFISEAVKVRNHQQEAWGGEGRGGEGRGGEKWDGDGDYSNRGMGGDGGERT